MALILFSNKQTADASKSFDSAMADPRPNTARLWFLAAQCYDIEGDDKKALAAFTRAARMSREEPEYAEALGVWLGNKGMVSDGLYWLKTAASIDSHSPVYLENYGLALVACQSGNDALGPLKKAALLEPDNEDYAIHYAGALHDVGLYDDSIVFIRKLIARNAATQDCWNLLMNCLLQNKNYGETKSTLKSIVEESEGQNKAIAARCLGDVCRMQGEAQESKAAYELALSLKPSAPLKEYLQKMLATQPHSASRTGAQTAAAANQAAAVKGQAASR